MKLSQSPLKPPFFKAGISINRNLFGFRNDRILSLEVDRIFSLSPTPLITTLLALINLSRP